MPAYESTNKSVILMSLIVYAGDDHCTISASH
jgi:hypothetical protein